MDQIEAAELFLDPEWRVNNLYTIVNKDGERIPFTPNHVQQKIREVKAPRKMILKARQFGVSTERIVNMFDETIHTRNLTSVILAHEQDSIKKLFRIVQRLYKFLPDPLKPRLDRGGGSKYEYFFPDLNSRIYCDLESRSDTVQRLHISEMAFMKDSAKVKSTLQAVPLNGQVTIETTANGMANHFYDMWVDKDQPYKKLFFPWFVFPEYKIPVQGKIVLADEEIVFVKKCKTNFSVAITPEQIMFRRFKKAELKSSSHDKTRVSFEQEYPEDEITCFLASGEAVMDLFKINKMLQELGTPEDDDGAGMRIYKRLDKSKTYVCGADPAEGIKRDFSVGVMIEIESKQVVAVIRGQWKPSDFAKKLNAVCKLYSSPRNGWPILAVERNNHGHAVLLELDEHLTYPNLYVHPQDERLGWKTDSITRPIMINAFIDAVEDRLLKVPDKDILTECLTLVDNAGKIEAAEGKHDDCITGCAIAFQVALSNSLSVYDNIENRILV